MAKEYELKYSAIEIDQKLDAVDQHEAELLALEKELEETKTHTDEIASQQSQVFFVTWGEDD